MVVSGPGLGGVVVHNPAVHVVMRMMVRSPAVHMVIRMVVRSPAVHMVVHMIVRNSAVQMVVRNPARSLRNLDMAGAATPCAPRQPNSN